jgi:hypothetical protein
MPTTRHKCPDSNGLRPVLGGLAPPIEPNPPVDHRAHRLGRVGLGQTGMSVPRCKWSGAGRTGFLACPPPHGLATHRIRVEVALRKDGTTSNEANADRSKSFNYKQLSSSTRCVGKTNEPNLVGGESGEMSPRWGCYGRRGVVVTLPGVRAQASRYRPFGARKAGIGS